MNSTCTMSLQENSTEKPLSLEKEVVNDTGPSVVSLAEEFIEYKISIYILTYVTVPVAVWGWIGNFLSFRIMTLPHNRRTSANIFLAALACSDSLHLLFTVHKWILSMTEYSSDWMCKMLFWYGLLGRCSSYAFIIIVTLQRCVAITLPLKRMEWMSVKSAKIILIPFVLLFNLAYNSYTVFWLTKADPGILACTSHGGTSLLAKIGAKVTLVVDIIFPFTTISILNVILIRAIRQRNKDLACLKEDNKSPTTRGEGHKKSNEGRQLTLTLILVCAAFLLLASPLFMLVVVFTFVDPLTSARRFANFTLMKNIFEQILHINAGINFWLYCLAGKRFRGDLRLIVGCKSVSSTGGSAFNESMSDFSTRNTET